MSKNLIKSQDRVRKFGEVFTPDWMVDKMLDTPGIKEDIEDISKRVLEPAAGDGNFLVAIIERRMEKIIENYSKSLKQFENYALLSISSLYAIELLEDNAQKCVMNMTTSFQKYYYRQASNFGQNIRKSVIDSANHIISKNVVQGDFLKRIDSHGDPIIFIEWKPLTDLGRRPETIRVQPTEYSLDDIYNKSQRQAGQIYDQESEVIQLDMYSLLEEKNPNRQVEKPKEKYSYKACLISNVHKEVMDLDE